MNQYTKSSNLVDFYNFKPVQLGGSVLRDNRVFFRGVRRQRGSGLGGIFGTFARSFIPFATKYIIPHAKTAIREIASDVLGNGRNFKDSVKQRGLAALKNLGRDIVNQKGSGRRKKNNKNSRRGNKLKKLNLKLKSKRKLKKVLKRTKKSKKSKKSKKTQPKTSDQLRYLF